MDTSPETILAMLTRLRSDPRFEEAIAIALRAMSSPGVTATSSGNVMKTDYLASLYRHRLESAVEGGRHHPGLAAMVAVLADTTDTG